MWKVTGLGILAAAVLTAAAGCGGGFVVDNNDDTTLTMLRTTWDIGGDEVELDVYGPDAPVILTVRYFIFGSDADLGSEGTIPMLSERLDEVEIGELGFGAQLMDVDLSPWDQYEYVYLRAIGTFPNLSFRLDPGTKYEFRPS
jgi:hypothetical protein